MCTNERIKYRSARGDRNNDLSLFTFRFFLLYKRFLSKRNRRLLLRLLSSGGGGNSAVISKTSLSSR